VVGRAAVSGADEGSTRVGAGVCTTVTGATGTAVSAGNHKSSPELPAAVLSVSWGGVSPDLDSGSNDNCAASRGCPSRSGWRATRPSKRSIERTAADGTIALGQSRRPTSHTVTAEPGGSDRKAMKMGSHSTRGRDRSSCSSRSRLTPRATPPPATSAAAKTVSDRDTRSRRVGASPCVRWRSAIRPLGSAVPAPAERLPFRDRAWLAPLPQFAVRSTLSVAADFPGCQTRCRRRPMRTADRDRGRGGG